jgi:hypothetical protein
MERLYEMHAFNELIAGYDPLAATPGAQYGGIVSNPKPQNAAGSRRYASPDSGNQRIFAGNRCARTAPPDAAPDAADAMLLANFATAVSHLDEWTCKLYANMLSNRKDALR